VLVGTPQLVFKSQANLSKFAMIFVMMIQHDFPAYWPDGFDNLL